MIATNATDATIIVAGIAAAGSIVTALMSRSNRKVITDTKESNTIEHGQVIERLDGLHRMTEEHNKRNGERFGQLDAHLDQLGSKFDRHLEWHLDRTNDGA
jgi:Ser/Thr protein kinase RdoA (MazF antagonist)